MIVREDRHESLQIPEPVSGGIPLQVSLDRDLVAIENSSIRQFVRVWLMV